MKKKVVSWIMIMAILLNYSHVNIFSTVFAEGESNSKNLKTEEQVNKNNNKILGLELSDSYLELGLDDEKNLEYKLITEDNYKEDIIWSCDNENVATVNNGMIKGINPGKATITAKTKDEKFIKFCEISVVGESSNTFSNGDYYEFTLEKNKNYEIINKSDKQISISFDYSKKYDSITYDNNGNISSYYKNDYGSRYISAQYKLKVGIKENDIKINIPNSDKDFIEIKEVEEPLLYEGILNKETTYELKTSRYKSLSLKQIDSGTIKYDYISYNSDGSISSFYKNDYGTISASNTTKKIRLKDKDYNYYIPYEVKDDLKIVESQEELIYDGVLKNNTTYEIINSRYSSFPLKQIDSGTKYYDYINYNSDGSISSFYKNDWGLISVSNNKKKIRLKDKDYNYYIPYEIKDDLKIVESQEELIYDGVLKSNTTYEITNSGDKSLSLKQVNSGTVYYDYIIYNADGSINNFYKNYSSSSINTNANKRKVRIKDKDYNYYIPYEIKDDLKIVESQEELIYDGVLKSNTTYEIVNTGQSMYLSKTDSGTIYYDYIIYNNDGSINNFYKNYSSSSINTNANKRKVRIKDKDYNYYIPYEIKDKISIISSDDLLLYEFITYTGKNYLIENKSDKKISIDSDQSCKFDGVVYNQDKSIDRFYVDGIGSSGIDFLKYESRKLSINENNKEDIKWFMPYEQKDSLEVKEIDEPALYKFEMEEDKSYKIYNKSNKNVVLENNNYNFKYDYVLYKADSNYKYMTNQYGDITLKTNEHIVIAKNQNNNANALWYIPYEYYNNEIVIKESESSIDELFDLQPKIKVDIRKVLSKNETDEENNIIEDTLDNYYISVKNKTQNKNINDIQLKGKYIVLQSNYVKPGDEISINFSSKKNDTLGKTVAVKLDENMQSNIDVDITQLGYIKVNEQEESKNTITNRTLIFNSKGENIKNISTKPKQAINSGYLQSGEYTVVLLKSSGDLWRLSNLTQFDERGFIEGTDYIKYKVEVIEGIINEIKPDTIPTVDEDRISFFDKEKTMVTSNSEVVSQNGLLEMRVQYKFKDRYTLQNVKNKYVVISLPSEVDLIDNSVIIDNKASTYSISNDRTLITIPINNMNGIIKFNVKPIESKEVNINVESRFLYGNKTIEETLGIINVDINYLTINGPTKTSSKQVRVYGLGPAGKKISLYNGSEKLKDVVALSSGKWTADIELKNAYNGSTHNIVAKVYTGTENEKVSNKLAIKYTSQMPSIKKLTMYYNNGKSINLTNYMKEGKNPVITIVPQNPLTFELELENGNENQEFYIISERNGESKSMKFTYDSKKGIWIATGFFDPNNKSYVPGTLRVTYKSRDFFNDLLYIDFESTEFKESLPDEWVNADVEVKKDTEDGFEFDVNLKDENKTKVNYKYNISKISSDITESNITSKGYIPIGNGQYLNTEDLGNILKGTIVDFGKGTMISFAAEIFNEYYETGLGGTFESLWDLFGKDGKVGDFMKTNKALFECFKSSNPEQRGAIGALWTLQEIKFILGIVPSVKGLKPKVAWVPILWTAAKTVVAGMAANLAYSAADQILDKTQEKLCGDSNGLGGVTTKWLIDPSGYVYEAVDSNTVEGVTTTVYYQDENGQAVKWNAEEYDQVNPLTTDKEGKYAWDVPEGLWQVKYEKEGYETTYSEWLPVPPPQTEVNIGIVSYEKPSIELFNIYEDRAEVTFNKYIDVSTINTDSIKLNDNLGNKISIGIEPFEQEEAKDKKVLAKKFILKTKTKNTLSFNNEYTLTVKNTVKTYAGVNNGSDIIAKTTYKPLPTVIKVDDSYEVKYGKEINIPVSIDNISNSEEFEVTATSSMDDIVSVSTNKVKFDKDGKAIIKAVGNLPGEAEITLKVEGTDLQATTKVNVIFSTEDDLPNTPAVIETKLIGDDRYKTAVEVSKKGWSKTDNVVIVNSSAIVDALSATPFAKRKDAPILLTEKDKLNNETKKEIERLGAKNVYIIGGTGVVSENVVSQLKDMNLNIDRISGDTRYTTSLEIAKRLENISEIAVVNGVTGLADAVSIAPVAADRNMPIVLASPNEGTRAFDEFIKDNKIKTSYVIGGEAAISKDVASKLPNANRLGGLSRNETNAIILEKFYTNKDLNNIFVAKDGMKKVDDLIDALAVGVLASKENSPLVIVGNNLDTKQEQLLKSKTPKEITQVGGNGNENAFSQIVNMFKK